MRKIAYTWWRDGKHYLGFLNDYPEYETQALSKKELLANLRSMLVDIQSDEIPYIRRVGKLVIAG
jgi:hypothetical protein